MHTILIWIFSSEPNTHKNKVAWSEDAFEKIILS
jgi:hypothetical protein